MTPDFTSGFPFRAAAGITSTRQAPINAPIGPPGIQSQFKFFGYPWLASNFVAANFLPSLFGSPPDLMGRYALGLDYTGQPVNELMGESADRPLLSNSPYELDLSGDRRRDTRTDRLMMRTNPSAGTTEYINVSDSSVVKSTAGLATDSDDAPFATADLERILRAYDADAGVLPERLWNVVDAFDPLKLCNVRDGNATHGNQPDLVKKQADAMFGTGPHIDAELLAAAQQLAGVNRRLVTTDSYDLPVPGAALLSRLVYGADGQPGVAGKDDDGKNGIDDVGELGWGDSDDWYPIMNGIRTDVEPPAVKLVPEHPTIVDLLKYRIQYERWKKDPTLPIFTEQQLTGIVNELLSPESIAENKMDLNRPFGDGADNNNNGIVDDPLEAGEPFLDVNGNGKRDDGTVAPAEPWIDVNADGNYNPPLDHLWDGLTSEPITFDYTNGQAVPIRKDAYNGMAIAGGVRNLNSQGRQLFARQLYCLMLLLVDENYLDMPDLPSLDGNNLNLELLLMKIAVDNGRTAFTANDSDKLEVRRKLTCKRIAQWAINCVDMRDADSIMTPFEYDENPWDGWGCPDNANPSVNIPLDGDVATDENKGEFIDWFTLDPTNANMRKPVKTLAAADAPVPANQTRGVVWGVERPELLITETLAFHDRRCTDEPDYGSVAKPPLPGAPPDKRDYDLDQRLKPRGSLFVELYNPWTPDGNKPREFYGQVPTDPTHSQGVMLNRLSDLADPVSGKYSPVWRMSILRDPLNGRMPIFRNPATGSLDSGVLKTVDDPSTAEIEGFPPPDPNDKETVTADSLTIDPDGYNIDLDEHAERQVYFTTGQNYATGTGSDTNRSDDDNSEYVQPNPTTIGQVGDLQFKDAAGAPLAKPVPVVNQLKVRVPPLPEPRLNVKVGSKSFPTVPTAKRDFIARRNRVESATPNDIDVTIAPILPGRMRWSARPACNSGASAQRPLARRITI